jgi:hypothetical protein
VLWVTIVAAASADVCHFCGGNRSNAHTVGLLGCLLYGFDLGCALIRLGRHARAKHPNLIRVRPSQGDSNGANGNY